MIAVNRLHSTPLFSSLDKRELAKLARNAADIQLQPGEWLVREGERPDFFVVLEGALQLKKELMGKEVAFSEIRAGEFYGEVAAAFGMLTVSSLQATEVTRVARFNALELRRLLQAPTACGSMLRSSMKARLDSGAAHALTLPGVRVHATSYGKDADDHPLFTFLRRNRIPFEVSEEEGAENTPLRSGTRSSSVSITVDGQQLQDISPRSVAAALGLSTTPQRVLYDLIIIGGGPAGLASAVYASSEGLSVLLLEREAMGGQAGTSSRIENYLGFPSGISGEELTERAVKQATRLGAELVLTRSVDAITRTEESCFLITLDGAEVVRSKALILATGVRWRQLTLPGVDGLLGRGVSYGTASIDPATIAGKDVFIVGGGNSAGQSAVFLSHYAQSVTLLVRGPGLSATMSQYLIEQLSAKENVVVEPSTQLIAVEGSNRLERIYTTSKKTTVERKADLLQIMIGADARTDWLPSGLEKDSHGFVRTGNDVTDFAWKKRLRKPLLLETSEPGLFCVGDVRSGSVKRVSSAAGEGSVAVSSVHQFLTALSCSS